ncbi:MAG: transglutaminase-like domain-containing protein [Schaedlerella sp.]|nr:transglutaminase-like domain-containing protein [Schaedlerella sp.]
MIDLVINALKMLMALLPVLLLCLMGKRINLPKQDRNKQYLMPVVAVIYVIIMMILSEPLNVWLISFIQWIPKALAALGTFFTGKLPEFISRGLLNLSASMSSFLDGLNLNFWIFFLANIVIMLLYFLVKKVSLRIMIRDAEDSSLYKELTEIFYEYFSEKGRWCIKESFVQARKLLEVFFYTALTISFVLMAFSIRFYRDGLMRTIFYPVFGIIVVGELFFYLDGATKREYIKNILGEDEDAYKIVNYSLLRKFLRSLFADKLLVENTSVNSALSYGVTNDEIIREMEKDEDPKITSFAAYVKALNAAGFQLDHNYLSSTRDLLNGKSILFNNPFYNDLIPYAFYPMNRRLLSHKKVLVILGRHAIEEDIRTWIEKGIEAVTNIPFIWKIGVLSEEEQELDIGILTRSDVLNIQLHNVNQDFLSEVGYVVIVEPSKLIATAQIGLNMVVKQCRKDDNDDIVYCMCDKNCDGLVDAMSHILMTSITEVSATKKHLGTSSYMCWESDGEYLHHRLIPNISRYLGLGTELSFAALKNQVSKAKWYGGESFPVADIKWIDKQYYYDLMKYAGLPTSQDAMDQHFETSANFWSAEVEENNYFTVEDESCNMFEIVRNFATRSTGQGFINVISTEYLLKDYMADNASIFETDAKAIPYIVADYARTERNTILRIILMMSTFSICEEELKKELSLMGIKVYSLKEQLWYELYKCYAVISQINELPEEYEKAVTYVSTKELVLNGKRIDISLFCTKEIYNIRTGNFEIAYSIENKEFLSSCISELKSAGYVAEDEKGQKYYLGAELSGHIYQRYLPGQFFTFGGKYYEMQYLTADNQILVRRAADHINGRPTYRQLREYTICGERESDKIGSHQDISGMKITKAYADIKVETSGYYKMEKYNDFETAKKVSFEGEKNGIPKRNYCNKEILKIQFTEKSSEFTDNVRYTITTLMNEVFKTIFAENQPYICALTDTSFMKEDSVKTPLTYGFKAENCNLEKNTIYILEDSQLDLGLIIAVERNLERILQIIQDYLEWHKQKLADSLNPPPEPVQPIEFEEPEEKEEKEEEPKEFGAKVKKAIKNILEKIKKWFGRFKKKKGTEEQDKPKDVDPEEKGIKEEDDFEDNKIKRKLIDGPKERQPGNIMYYAYEKLDEVEKQVYEKVLNAVKNFETVVTGIPKGMNKDQIIKIVHYIDRDHPELFWFQYGAMIYHDLSGVIVTKVELKYRMSREETQKRQEQINAAEEEFTKTITEDLSDCETALRIYENIIRLTDYDSIGLEVQEKDKNSAEKPDDLRSIYGVIVNKKAVCAGYAKATQYYMQKYGIECTYVLSEEHAWNLVKLEGDYYHLDTTWGDHSNTKESLNISDEIDYDCFCITTEEVEKLKQHKAKEELPLPVCTAVKCNYHYRMGMYFEAYDLEKLKQAVCEMLSRGNQSVSVKCADNMVFKDFQKNLITEQKFSEIIQYVSLNSSIKLDSAYSYSEKEERNVITFYVNKI